jgi:hypothetical protein
MIKCELECAVYFCSAYASIVKISRNSSAKINTAYCNLYYTVFRKYKLGKIKGSTGNMKWHLERQHRNKLLQDPSKLKLTPVHFRQETKVCRIIALSSL